MLRSLFPLVMQKEKDTNELEAAARCSAQNEEIKNETALRKSAAASL